MENAEVPWIDAPLIDGEIQMRYRHVHSHAMSFEFLGEDGEVEIEAGVKWDGCINWNTSDDFAYHFCDPEDVARLARAFDRAWELTSKLLPVWDAPRKTPALQEPGPLTPSAPDASSANSGPAPR